MNLNSTSTTGLDRAAYPSDIDPAAYSPGLLSASRHPRRLSFSLSHHLLSKRERLIQHILCTRALSLGLIQSLIREALVSRQSASSDEVQVQIDFMHSDLNDQIYTLRGQLRKLKSMNEVLGEMVATAQELAHYHSGDGVI